MRTCRRILLTKGGLDGHTRGIEQLATFLRDEGFEIVYLGIYQTPEAIAQAAFQEDPDVIGVSVLSGGHRGVFERLMGILRESGEEWVVVAGGIIPKYDQRYLKELGVRACFTPGASIEKTITPYFKDLVLPEREKKADELYEELCKGDTRALAQYLTALITGDETARALVAKNARSARAHIVGFTGSGGAGKSSLVACLVELMHRESRVAALCADPAAVSGGAFLGDRIRFHGPERRHVVLNPNVFLRSVAAREVWKGVTPETPALCAAIAQGGYGTIFLESVGAGQYDLGFRDVADTLVAVVHPDMGDEIQMMKGGMLETADIIAVNYADRPQADATVALLTHHFSKKRGKGWKVPVLKTVASSAGGADSGMLELAQAIECHREFLGKTKKP